MLHADPVDSCSKHGQENAHRFFIFQHNDLELAKKIIEDMKGQTPTQPQTLEENFLVGLSQKSESRGVMCRFQPTN